MANDMMMAFAKEIMGKTDHLEDKLAFLGLQSTKEYFYAYLRCFICGMSCQQVRKIFDKGECSVEDICEIMLKDIGKRVAGHNREEDIKKLQEETGRLRKQLLEIEGRKDKLEAALAAKERENNNLDASIEAKDHVQKQLREKIQQLNQCIVDLEKENEVLRKREVSPVKEELSNKESGNSEETEQKEKTWTEKLKSFFCKGENKGKQKEESFENRFMKDELAKESFRTEVLLNTKFSPEQRDYLFTLLEEGESYVNIRPFANPCISVEDMKRYYHLCTLGRKQV